MKSSVRKSKKPSVPPRTRRQAGTRLKHLCSLSIDSKASFVRLSSVVCTIGPASREVRVLQEMIAAGMNIARVKMIPDSHEYHAETIANIRAAVENYRRTCDHPVEVAIALDTKGPEIRSGLLTDKEVELKKGGSIRLTTDTQFASNGNAQILYVDYPKLPKVVFPGALIYLDNGMICLRVSDVGFNNVDCIIDQGGMLGSEKVINLPDIDIDLPNVSNKDRADLIFAVEQEVDMIFASYIRNRKAIEEIKLVLGEKGKDIYIISKIENKDGIRFLDEIIDASDGIMVARGVLGIQIPIEKIFLAQKCVIAKCNKAGVPVICATQMLDSMIDKPRPTRAESSDVANAILDGADCLMLSGETAEGEYPLECVRVMVGICREAEEVVWHKQLFADLTRVVQPPLTKTQSVAIAAVEASAQSFAVAILVVTETGCSAHLISKFRPTCPIIAITPFSGTARKCRLFRGIFPVVCTSNDPEEDWLTYMDCRIICGLEAGIKYGFLKPNDSVIIVTGSTKGAGHTNAMKVISVPEKLDNTLKFINFE